MYTPKHFSAPSSESLQALVSRYPLAQLVTSDASGLWCCNPIPLYAPSGLEVGSRLVGHVAKANPLWQHHSSVLAIFTGPQTYITPNAYPSKLEHHKVVPTYNYATVQVRGELIAYTDAPRKLQVVSILTDHFEQSQPKPWAVNDAPADFVQTNLDAIVAIEILIQSVEGKFKWSQNRSQADQAGVAQYLTENDQAHDHLFMCQLMQADTDRTKPK